MTVKGGSHGIMCGIAETWAGDSFLLNWFAATCCAMVFVVLFSGIVFYKLYWPSQVTYEKWQWKTNPKFPTPEKVRDEIIQTLKSVFCAALCPAMALWLYAQGDTSPIPQYGFCGTTAENGVGYNFITFLIVWIGSDLWESVYHLIGHSFPFMWNWHRHHHVFFNPTPFAVVADEFMDQFFRALPLVVFPLVMPTNLDILYFTFTILFYGTGVYHHSGYELRWPNAHTGFFNTSYHHYLHHSISINRKPYHCGFMFQVWDQLFGSVYHGKCFCVHCSQKQGLRTREQFDAVVKPDYRKLLRPSFWITADLNMLKVVTGTSASDVNEELQKEEAIDTTEMKTSLHTDKSHSLLASGVSACVARATMFS
jgi:lathosterol oxidase